MDTSIQENLRQKALNKKPSHRNWREWYAICDSLEENVKILCSEIDYLNRSKWGALMIWISIGCTISYLIMHYGTV